VQAGERLVKPESLQNQRIACLGTSGHPLAARENREAEFHWKCNDSTRAMIGYLPGGAMEGLGASGRFV
jgi:hypothetical protein